MRNLNGKADSSKGPSDNAWQWTCPCGQKLGIQTVDPVTNEEALIIKHKDKTVVSHGGPESWIRVNCHRCGREWSLSGDEPVLENYDNGKEG